jgi:isoleucyl-tRNA synthetase
MELKLSDKLNLSGFLLAQEPFTHKYPYDWRTKKPVIVRATAQWFVDLSHVHEKAVEAIQNVHMYPPTCMAHMFFYKYFLFYFILCYFLFFYII